MSNCARILLFMFVSVSIIEAQTTPSNPFQGPPSPPTPPAASLICTLQLMGGKLVCVLPIPAPVVQKLTGGSCTNADGSIGLFIQLPDSTCLPVIVTGSTAATAANNGSAARGLALLAGGGAVIQVPPVKAP